MLAMSIVGFGKSGKTTLTQKLAKYFEGQGLKVGIAKFSHHNFDQPDTDTSKLMAPGRAVIGLKLGQTAETMIHWSKEGFLPDLMPLLGSDILLVEGGKNLNWLPRIICLNRENDLTELEKLKPALAIGTYGLSVQGIKNFTEDSDLTELGQWIKEHAFSLPGLNCGACGYTDCGGLAQEIVLGNKQVSDCTSSQGAVQVKINGLTIALNPFTQNMLAGSLRGMLSALKGYQAGQKITITLDS